MPIVVLIICSMCLLACSAGEGVEAAQTGEACAASNALAQCPPNTQGTLEAMAESNCSADGSVDVDSVSGTGSGEISQICVGSGECRVVCTLIEPCAFGVTSVSMSNGVVCSPPPCGNGICESGENPENCAVDCAAASCDDGDTRCAMDEIESCNAQGLWERAACGCPFP